MIVKNMKSDKAKGRNYEIGTLYVFILIAYFTPVPTPQSFL